MSNLSSQSSLLNLTPTVEPIQTATSEFYTSDELSQPSFLATLVQAIGENNELLPENLQMSEKEIVQEFMLKSQTKSLLSDFNDEQKTSIFDSLSFMQVLSVLENLQIQSSDVKLSQLSTQTQQFVQTQSNLDALKGAKSLNELLQIAKNLNLEVSNIKIDKIFELKTVFPNLNKANFFSTNVESAFKEFLHTKIAKIIKENESKISTLHSKPKSQDTSTLLSKALQSFAKDGDEATLLKNDEAKNTLQKNLEFVNEGEELSLKKTNSQSIKEPEKLLFTSEKVIKSQMNITPKQENFNEKVDIFSEKNSQNTKEVSFKELTKELKSNGQNVKDEVQKEVLSKPSTTIKSSQETLAQSKIISTVNEILNQNIKNKEPKKEILHSEKEHKIAKDTQKEVKISSNEKVVRVPFDEKIEQKSVAKTQTEPEKKEPKAQILAKDEPQNTKTKNYNVENKNLSSQENINKEFKAELTKENTSLNTENKTNANNANLENSINKVQNKISENINTNLNNASNQNSSEKEALKSQNEPNSNFIASDDNSELNSLIKDLSQVSRSELKSELNVKETFTRFAQDFKEQMQNYKAPITRFNITLNPSHLGEVEVTLIQRGSNLHINFNSNTSAMNLFIQNQAEFKNSLVNMGFTGLEMNFSDQGKKDRQQSKNRSGYGFKEELQTNENSALEIILAKYF